MNPDRQSRSPRDSRKNTSNRITELIAREAAQFILHEAGHGSLITVTRAQSMAHGSRNGMSAGTHHIIVFVSIFPVEKARTALAFLERKRKAFSDHLKSRARLRLPRIDFQLDNVIADSPAIMQNSSDIPAHAEMGADSAQ